VVVIREIPVVAASEVETAVITTEAVTIPVGMMVVEGAIAEVATAAVAGIELNNLHWMRMDAN
jgi:hypothetical protein